MSKTLEGSAIRCVPLEILQIIPKFDGDEKLLNLFIKKCEYVISLFKGDDKDYTQHLYLFHAITGRLTGKAAHLVSEREDIETWPEVKTALIQHFGDPRSEECIVIELENIKIHSGETYLQLCNRIQNVRSTLFSKISIIQNETIKQSKIAIYNNLALNVFLYNLPSDMIRIVRLKSGTSPTLESALTIVLEETNFMQQYNARNKNRMQTTQNPQINFQNRSPFHAHTNMQLQQKFGASIPNQGFRINANNNFPNKNVNFKYGIQPNQIPATNFRFGIPNHIPQQTQKNYNFGQPQNFNFGQRQNFNPPFFKQNQNFNPMQRQNANFNNNFNRPQGQMFNQNFNHNNRFNNQQQNVKPNVIDTDVSMRTVQPVKNNALQTNLQNNELFYNNASNYENNLYSSDYSEDEYNYYCQDNVLENAYYVDPTYDMASEQTNCEFEEIVNDSDENFPLEASKLENQK